MSGSGLPFERTRYNPVQDVTPEEAERNKRAMGKSKAEQEADIPNKGKAEQAGDDKE